MNRLLLLWILFGCAGCASRPAPVASDFETDGLRQDAYVLRSPSPKRASSSPGERTRLEAEWPPVNELSLPGDWSVRRVNPSRPAVAALVTRSGLRACSKRIAKGEPCQGIPAPTPAPAPTGAVILRTAPNGYGAPGLELTTR